MADDLLEAFAKHYRGRHRPEDALWWLHHPHSPGPSSAAPPQLLLLAAVEELEQHGDHTAATALLHSAAEVLAADRRASLDALNLANGITHARPGDQPGPARPE